MRAIHFLLLFAIFLSFQLVLAGRGKGGGRGGGGGGKPADGPKNQGDSEKNKSDKQKAVDAPSSYNPKPPTAKTATPRKDKEKWKKEYSDYLIKYNKPADRLEFRLSIFQINVEEIIRHNNEYLVGVVSWWKGYNFFTDIADDELVFYTGYVDDPDGIVITSSANTSRIRRSTSEPDDSLDYRSKGIISAAKDQGECGCCFAFAALGCMESRYAKQYGDIIDLSEQHVLDCSTNEGNKGCDGGNFQRTFKFLETVGVDTEKNNMYKAINQSCADNNQKEYTNRVLKWERVDGDEDEMRQAVLRYGPIVASLTVDRDFFSYEGGAFTTPNDTVPNHAVVIIGYGKEKEHDVWIIKNSWGTNWGQQGFMNIQRNVNMRQIADGAYAILEVSGASLGCKAVWIGIFASSLLSSMYTSYTFAL